MHVPRIEHTATLLPDGTVLVAGGRTNNYYETTFWAELYDPSTGAFSAGIPMTAGRAGHQATRLRDGRVLVTGGLTTSPWPTRSPQTLASADLYIPAVLVPDKIVNELQFDRTSVGMGSSYSVKFSGSNLTSQTFFDVRFTSPESTESAVVLNWQRGLTASHNVPFGIAPGSWIINSVRAHEIETDHTGGFFPVSATITVSP
jgi:hypothetical protein